MHLRKKLKGLTLVSGGSTFNSYALGFGMSFEDNMRVEMYICMTLVLTIFLLNIVFLCSSNADGLQLHVLGKYGLFQYGTGVLFCAPREHNFHVP
jgi:hypothetical protein